MNDDDKAQAELQFRLGFVTGALSLDDNRAKLVAAMHTPAGNRIAGLLTHLRDLLTTTLREAEAEEAEEEPDISELAEGFMRAGAPAMELIDAARAVVSAAAEEENEVSGELAEALDQLAKATLRKVKSEGLAFAVLADLVMTRDLLEIAQATGRKNDEAMAVLKRESEIWASARAIVYDALEDAMKESDV